MVRYGSLTAQTRFEQLPKGAGTIGHRRFSGVQFALIEPSKHGIGNIFLTRRLQVAFP